MIDVVGHFGSRLSYATVADHVARGLFDCKALGSITNLDDKFLDGGAWGARPSDAQGKKVILISDARDYLVEALVSGYGRENVAIFVCPNTNRLSDERVRSCRSVGRIYTPSSWCRGAIYDAVDEAPALDPDILVMPLGVDSPFSTSWASRNRHVSLVSMLHVTTDTFLPGRKGTEELLRAWKLAEMNRVATLTVHCLPQIYPTLYQEIGDLDLLDKVKLISAQYRGTSPSELFDLVGQHDLLVAPSRSEGFGIMPLSALVSGTPVLTTAGTGQDEYLAEINDAGEHEVLGGWLQVPTLGSAELPGEDGYAPTIRIDQLAFSLVAARRLYDELLAGAQKNLKAQAGWSWFARRTAWAKSLVEWAREETT